ncbi:MAG TPA: OmpA family protein, partial [Candidatus Competibacter sp.]|nr:OmpA family protein [Candidatus Competibacter sp.]
RAQLSATDTDGSAKHILVIDPLIDGVSGAQSVATRSMEVRLVELVKSKYPRFEVEPFSTSTVAKSPIVLVGTFTSVNKEGKTEGVREAYRVCLALADLKSGKIISKGVARAKPEGVNTTPTQYFKDSPTWAPDQATEGYIKTCQGTKAGDPINPAYVDRILTAALVSEAIDAYNNRQYREALDLYQSALHSPGGEQLRVYNGLYLSNWKLGHRDEATQAFGKVVDYGLVNKRLAVKFLFKPGSTDFWADRRVTGPYPIWLEQIAERTSQYQGCLEIVGHTSRTGPEPINERLSLLRAERIKQKLDRDVPALKTRTIANGVGSKENLIGTGTDDARDALDRRVEFKVVGCRAPG